MIKVYLKENEKSSKDFLKEVLEKYNITSYKLKYSENGKPFLDCCYYISISHSLNFTAISIGLVDHGIDIQYIDLNKRIEQLKNKVFKNKVDDFYIHWTKKEAYVKLVDGSIFFEYELDNYKDFQTIFVNDSYNNKYYLTCSEDFIVYKE